MKNSQIPEGWFAGQSRAGVRGVVNAEVAGAIQSYHRLYDEHLGLSNDRFSKVSNQAGVKTEGEGDIVTTTAINSSYT